MLASYVWRDLVRNPRRSIATLTGITLGVGLFSAVLFFIDGSSASMTQRAVQPLPIDIQRMLTAPLGGRLQLGQSTDVRGPVAEGQRVTVRLELVNGTAAAANEVVLRSEPPDEFAYVAGSATVRGVPVEDGLVDNPFARGAARTGLNLGTVEPGATVRVSYEVQARVPVTPADGLGLRTSFSSREVVTPVPANAPEPLGPDELATRISRIAGVASADPLSFVDVPGPAVSAGPVAATGSVRVFAFDAGYQRRYDDIDLVDGVLRPGAALLSLEAADALGVEVGDGVDLALPGAAGPLRLEVSGTADLRRAKALFYSRQGRHLEEFLYSPYSVVIDPATFEDSVVPALLASSAVLGGERNGPVREVDIRVERSRLDADPGTALEQTTRIAAAVAEVAPGQDYLVDNVSNTLTVAREDAAVAKRMFVFLGVPGGMLAAVLAGYAGAVLASAQRREQAILRVRGAGARHLTTMLAIRSGALTAAGAVVGLAVGLLSAVAVLGVEAVSRAAVPSLLFSGLVGAGGGFLAAGYALYAAGRAAIRREIDADRARLFSRPPLWWRARLDLVALLCVGLLAGLAVRADAFAGTPGSVYEARGVGLNLWLLALPLGAWVAGALLAGRVFARAVAVLPAGPSFGHVTAGIVGRSLRRRSWIAAQGMIVICLVVGAVTSVTVFTASYDEAKAADARFTLGSDLKVAPDPTTSRTLDGGFADELRTVDGIAAATPVVYGVENSVVRSTRNQDVANVAAVDPATFLDVAALRDENFVGTTAAEALTALADDPGGVLLSAEMAEFVSVAPGDRVRVLFAQGTDVQALSEMRVAGLFDRLPAFPDGADAMVNIAHQARVVPSTLPDFFLARTVDRRPSTLAAAVTDLTGRTGADGRVAVETRETTLAKDQSSLAALNIRGLLTLDAGYGLAMAVVAIGIFVFGLLLQRRREYVTMRAQGLQSAEIRTVIVAEAGTVGLAACVAGIAVGLAMAVFLVGVLRPLFVLAPDLVVPVPGILTLVLALLGSTLVSSSAASSLVGRLKPTELLRDE
ncbi:FtsX-like permease family protein [Geodermatophilus sp. YIM 151500]|uniref:FtsX-like permease family protein n=1 Tax=Geodermatophilus sp. YIM 151500 TaxID=2984531 RepID=UPI0021E49208|nr:FtsX-like permease family protein [Geodermatophilus sp. YIM 151500]MCV2491972.1 FtsX-like permease family protein [Geodermatophilus sp. YIM 151500]